MNYRSVVCWFQQNIAIESYYDLDGICKEIESEAYLPSSLVAKTYSATFFAFVLSGKGITSVPSSPLRQISHVEAIHSLSSSRTAYIRSSRKQSTASMVMALWVKQASRRFKSTESFTVGGVNGPAATRNA